MSKEDIFTDAPFEVLVKDEEVKSEEKKEKVKTKRNTEKVALEEKVIKEIQPIKNMVTGIKTGDEVYWEGHLYRDSYGNGKTKASFPRTKGTVDILNKHSFPVHIKGKGWVSIPQIKKV